MKKKEDAISREKVLMAIEMIDPHTPETNALMGTLRLVVEGLPAIKPEEEGETILLANAIS